MPHPKRSFTHECETIDPWLRTPMPVAIPIIAAKAFLPGLRNDKLLSA
jgi:hypothetical protein